MTGGHRRLEHWGLVLLAACLGVVQFNLLAAQVLFGLAAVVWLWTVLTDRERPDLPAFFWPLAAYGGLTVASATVSFDPRASLIDCKQLVLFLMVPIVMRFARGGRAMTVLNVVMAFGAIGALVGVVEATMFGFDSLSNRPTGSLSHYMTYSGVIMLVLSATIARLLFYSSQRIWPGIAVPALAAALALTFTRNAWLGAIAAVSVLFVIKQVRWLLVVPVLVGLVLLVAPANLRQRAYSIADLQDESNKDRLQMVVMGLHMVRDHPLFGVGPDMVKVVYPEYRPADAVHPTNPHLHNVPIQIAAERGLPALLAWGVFLAVAILGLVKGVRAGPRALSAAGLAAVVAMVVAGLFEYNFGDSEFLMLFLGLITLPFAAQAGVTPTSAAAGDRA
jgi:O-antigen ligase